MAIFVAMAAVVAGAGFATMSLAARPERVATGLVGAPSAEESIAQSRATVSFFERRLAVDPGDIDILNRLSALYLQRLRETGSFSDLALALQASRASLRVVPPVRNASGLTSRAMAEFASHEFGPARDDARLLLKVDASRTAYALLSDADAELGDYPAAEAAYGQLRRGVGDADENVATRRARFAQLHGENELAKDAFSSALAMELGRTVPSRERIAWYYWQIGDTAFFSGDYAAARSSYDEALRVYPGYFRALASSGRLEAAQGESRRAIDDYQGAIAELPDPTFVAELGDVYAVSGDRVSAAREYALVDFIGRLSTINGVMYNRQLVMFDADHDRNASEAFRLAKHEYRVRRDILGADAVAWTALKAGKLGDANVAMRAALRLGTRDPRLFYHAGMIAFASRDDRNARKFLQEALELSPQFDVLQARVARAALNRVTGIDTVQAP